MPRGRTKRRGGMRSTSYRPTTAPTARRVTPRSAGLKVGRCRVSLELTSLSEVQIATWMSSTTSGQAITASTATPDMSR